MTNNFKNRLEYLDEEQIDQTIAVLELVKSSLKRKVVLPVVSSDTHRFALIIDGIGRDDNTDKSDKHFDRWLGVMNEHFT